MVQNETLYVGIEISSGIRPITCAMLDQKLNIILLERKSIVNVITNLQPHLSIMLAVNVAFRGRSSSAAGEYNVFTDLQKELAHAGFKPYLSNYACRQWVETYPAECFNALAGQALFSSHSTRGRMQRAAILVDQGLQINESMKLCKETDLKKNSIYTPRELNALVAAGIAWMLVNKPVNIDLTREWDKQMISIPREDKDCWRKKPVQLRSEPVEN